MNDALTVALIETIIKYGPVVALNLFQALNDKDITPEKIRSLKVKDPNEYFGGTNA